MITIRITGPSGQPAELKIDTAWEEPGVIQIRCKELDDAAPIRKWLRDEAMGLFGHTFPSDRYACPSDLHYACLCSPPRGWELEPFIRCADDAHPVKSPTIYDDQGQVIGIG